MKIHLNIYGCFFFFFFKLTSYYSSETTDSSLVKYAGLHHLVNKNVYNTLLLMHGSGNS